MNARNRLRLLRYRAGWTGRRPCAVILLERLGDIVACGPVARELKRRDPRAFVVWICRPPFQELAAAIPGIDAVVVATSLDEVENLQPELKRWQVVDLTLRGKTYADNIREWEKAEGDPAINTESYYLHGPLLKAMTGGAGFSVADETPRLQIPESARREVDALNLPSDFVVLHCQGDEGARNWIPEGWRQLAALLREHGLSPVEIGGRVPSQGALSEGSIDLTGRTSILASAELIRRARFFVGIDSGPAHLANAVGQAGIVLTGRYRIFDSYIPFTGPYGGGGCGLVVQHHEECRFLPFSEVAAAANQLLQQLGSVPVEQLAFNVRRTPSADRAPPPVPGSTVSAPRQGIRHHVDQIRQQRDGTVWATGWAFLAESERPPDSIVYARPLGADQFCVRASVPFSRLERPDIADQFKNPRLAFTGWSIRIGREELAQASTLLVQDSLTGTYYRLQDLGNLPGEATSP